MSNTVTVTPSDTTQYVENLLLKILKNGNLQRVAGTEHLGVFLYKSAQASETAVRDHARNVVLAVLDKFFKAPYASNEFHFRVKYEAMERFPTLNPAVDKYKVVFEVAFLAPSVLEAFYRYKEQQFSVDSIKMFDRRKKTTIKYQYTFDPKDHDWQLRGAEVRLHPYLPLSPQQVGDKRQELRRHGLVLRSYVELKDTGYGLLNLAHKTQVMEPSLVHKALSILFRENPVAKLALRERASTVEVRYMRQHKLSDPKSLTFH